MNHIQKEMIPYTLTSCTLVTYSGRRIKLDLVPGQMFRKPMRLLEELIVTQFTSTENNDPVIRAEIKAKPLWRE